MVGESIHKPFAVLLSGTAVNPSRMNSPPKATSTLPAGSSKRLPFTVASKLFKVLMKFTKPVPTTPSRAPGACVIANGLIDPFANAAIRCWCPANPDSYNADRSG